LPELQRCPAADRPGPTDGLVDAQWNVADPRFAANYEKVEQGLTAYVRDAIIANASGARTHA
jgi:hypothetical protein